MHRRRSMAFTILTALSFAAAQARTIHVSPNGDDGGPGTAESPLRTIGKAAEAARAGDVVMVRTGVYKGHVYLRRSGEPDRPIVFRSAPGEKPVVDGDGKGRIELQSEGGWRNPIGWITVEGFEVRNGWDGIKFYNAHHIVLKSNSIHDNLNQGILGNGHHVRIVGNLIFRNGIKPGNEKSNLEHGIYGTGSDFEIAGNVIHSNRAYGIQVAGYPFKPDGHAGPEFASACRWLIHHNTIAFQQNRAGIVIWQGGATDCVVESNLFFENSVTLDRGACQGIDFVGAGGGHVIRRNFFFGPGRTSIGEHGGHAASDNVEGKDPLFLDADRFDFRLREGSPAAGYGASASPPASDPARTAGVVLGIEGTAFTLDGRKTFLLGASYYAALGAPDETIARDLDDLRALGFNWIRVFAVWDMFDHDVSAVDASGKAREPHLSRLRAVVAAAEERGMVVDVSLARCPRLPDQEAHLRATETLARALAGRRNVYFDLANERDQNYAGGTFVSFPELKALRDRVKATDPNRLVTASGEPADRADLERYLVEAGLDFLSPHLQRDAGTEGRTAGATRKFLGWMKELGREAPIHYQEPFRRDYFDPRGPWQPDVETFSTDLRNARAGGAAGWCFHNGSPSPPERFPAGRRRSFDLRASQGRLMDQLDEVEREFVKSAAACLR